MPCKLTHPHSSFQSFDLTAHPLMRCIARRPLHSHNAQLETNTSPKYQHDLSVSTRDVTTNTPCTSWNVRCDDSACPCGATVQGNATKLWPEVDTHTCGTAITNLSSILTRLAIHSSANTKEYITTVRELASNWHMRAVCVRARGTRSHSHMHSAQTGSQKHTPISEMRQNCRRPHCSTRGLSVVTRGCERKIC
jgi:hypothetical protein